MIRKKTVWVNGCFDILHPGHFELLRYAASLGNVHVGIDSDDRVRKSKGPNRPIHDETFRADMLSSLTFVKKVYIFETDWDLRLITKKLKPDFLVIGDEYKDKTIIGAENAKRIVFFPKSLLSTTEIINRIKNG
jgi:D-beta-D-heptose 7-phosphate kinase/D-beta-D-heptose 1-phosphate adenosyltransferase